MKKKLLLLAITGIIFTSGCSDLNGETILETDDFTITEKEFYAELKDRYGESMIREMVATKIHEFPNIEISDEEIQKELELYKSMFESEEEYEANLESLGISEEEQIEQLIQNLKHSKWMEQRISNIEVSEEEIKDRFKYLESEYYLNLIQLNDITKVKEVKQKLQEGVSFEQLVNEYSPYMMYEKNGAPYYIGDFGEETVQVIQSMNPQQIEGPIEINGTYYFVEMISKNKRNYEELKNEIESQLKHEIASTIDPVQEILEVAKIHDEVLKEKLRGE